MTPRYTEGVPPRELSLVSRHAPDRQSRRSCTSCPHNFLRMARWIASPITSLPRVSDGEPDDPMWYANQTLVEEHDEHPSGQQELYVVIEGEIIFELDSEHARLDAGTVLAVTDPSVRRSARAVAPGTALLIIGASDEPFRSTWNPTHFSDVPRPD